MDSKFKDVSKLLVAVGEMVIEFPSAVEVLEVVEVVEIVEVFVGRCQVSFDL